MWSPLTRVITTNAYQTYFGDDFVRHLNVESLCCSPETNIIFYVNYNLKIFKYKLKNKMKADQKNR